MEPDLKFSDETRLQKSEGKPTFLEKNLTPEEFAKVEAIATRHKGDVVFEWFLKSSSSLWKSIEPVQNFFLAQMERGKHVTNPIMGIVFLLTVLVTGFLTVGVLTFILAPILQIILVVVVMLSTIVRALLQKIRVMR